MIYNPLRIKTEIANAIETLGWDELDNIVVEIGGSSVSGIDVGENYNEKWQSPIGTRNITKMHLLSLKT